MTNQGRFGTLHCNGNRLVRTPHIDSLAERGVRMDLTADPCEMNIPVERPEAATLRQDLKQKLAASMNELGDPFPEAFVA